MQNVLQQSIGSAEMEFLRKQQILSEKEVAWKMGDLLVAENLETGDKRILGEHSKILLGQRRILKD